ncbi:hypothetical protein BN961_02566 [Afipia felis]|uniref:Uncharacterized protein n=2 Tax=Afipia felis TaxID=1035 RepID=A0A090MP16_AFIFE|nr:hypothetical protein AfiDRAFT_2768 [Afipia sp. 1NLS2]CEG09145.1 hypothetical protein BN961_02566 [Afipia felis]
MALVHSLVLARVPANTEQMGHLIAGKPAVTGFPFGWQNHTYDATVEDFAAWGWRIAFLLSAVLVVLPADKLRLFFVVVLIALAAQMALYAFGIRFI